MFYDFPYLYTAPCEEEREVRYKQGGSGRWTQRRVGVRSLAWGDEKWLARGPVCVEMAAGPDEAGGLREK